MDTISRPIHSPQSNTDRSVRAVAALAFAIGSIMVFIIGFSHPELIHNVAHDLRHAAGFPCH